MKNRIKLAYILFTALFAFTACAPQEFDDYDLGSTSTVSEDQIHLTVTPGKAVPADMAEKYNWMDQELLLSFVFDYKVTFDFDPNKNLVSQVIDFGNNSSVKSREGAFTYERAKAGEYTVTLTVYAADGTKATTSTKVTISEDFPAPPVDYGAILTDNGNGQTWKIKAAYMSNAGNFEEIWWDILSAGEATALTDDSFTFNANGSFIYENNGNSFLNESLASLFPDGNPAGSFITEHYEPKSDAKWEMEGDVLVLHSGFLGYAVAPEDLTKTEYQIVDASDSEIHFVYYPIEGVAWHFVIAPAMSRMELLTANSSKAWKWRPAASGSGLVMTRTWTDEVWWTVDASAAGSEAAYDDILTFHANGKVVYQNNGNSYMNEGCASMFSDGDPEGSFVTTQYTPSAGATWKFETVDNVLNLVLTDAFPMYGLSPEVIAEGYYELRTLSADLLQISFVAGNGEWEVTWNYYLVPAN